MGDISDALPKQSKTVEAIYNFYKNNEKPHMPATIAISEIGDPCHRKLWYKFRHCFQKVKTTGRMLRLFDTGNKEEERFINDLRAIGCEVMARDENGKQFLVTDFGGHVRGRLDGFVKGIPEAPKTWHVLELKTHNDKNFKQLVKKGVSVSNPKHYVQCQLYMHYNDLERALYLATNKNTDDLYSNRIKYDKEYCEKQIRKAKSVILSQYPPEKASDNPNSFVCKYCDSKDICHRILERAFPVLFISCRQCCHATPLIDNNGDKYGHWKCEKYNKDLSFEDQLKACEDHLVLPCLIKDKEDGYGKDEDGKEYIHYLEDEREWYQGPAKGAYSSKELLQLDHSILGSRLIQEAKKLFDTEIQEDNCSLVHFNSQLLDSCNPEELVKLWNDRWNENLLNLIPVKTIECDGEIIKEYYGKRYAVYIKSENMCEIRQEIPF